MTENDRAGATTADDTTSGLPVSRLGTILRAFRHRNYRLFFTGQVISMSGTWMQSVAQSWLVYRLTGGSALMLGVVAFATHLPVLLLGPLGGVAADRFDLRRIIMAAQTAAMLLAFVLAALTLTGHIRVWHLPILAVLLGVVNAFDVPARQSFMVELVGKEDLINAIALNSSLFNAARVVGPALAGVVVAAVGEGWCFFINGLSFVAVLTGLLLMRVEARPRDAELESTRQRIAEGFRYVWQTRSIRTLLALLAMVSLLGMPYAVLMPIMAGEVLHGGPRAFGILMGAAGIGALLGALTLAARRGVRGLERWISISITGFSICLMLFAASRLFWLSAALLVPAGFFLIGQMASSNTLVQTIVPDHLRGRVMSVYSMMFIGMAPFGALLAGTIAHALGAPWTIALGGTACFAGGLFFRRHLTAVQQRA